MTPRILLSLFTSCAVLSTTRAQLFNVNLLENGDAESGPGSTDGSLVATIPGWTPGGNFTVVQYGASDGFPTINDLGSAERGANFFAGGPANGFSSAIQTIDLAAYAPWIDVGSLPFELTAFLGGFDSQEDQAVFSVSFQSSEGVALGGAHLGPVTAADRTHVSGTIFQGTGGLTQVPQLGEFSR